MSNRAVIGLGFGDEGKGVVTEYLCAQDPTNTIVARFSGGQQAGHKVVKGQLEHVFSSFGAGTLSGCPTYWSKECTFNPECLLDEYRSLTVMGVYPKIYIHPLALATTPYDIHAISTEEKHGTTGHGIYRTKYRTESSGAGFYAQDVFKGSPELLDLLLKRVEEFYGFKTDIEDYIHSIISLRKLLDKDIFVQTNIPQHNHIVFEGSQGLMLDPEIGTMPHCTPSDLTPRSILKYGLDEIFLITRCYQTRHGNGPMTNIHKPVNPINNDHETNKHNIYQGPFRCTVLDIDQLRHAKELGIDKYIQPRTKVNLVVTCLDQLLTYEASLDKSYIKSDNAEEFVALIGKYLNIKDGLYMNSSPYSFLKKL